MTEYKGITYNIMAEYKGPPFSVPLERDLNVKAEGLFGKVSFLRKYIMCTK